MAAAGFPTRSAAELLPDLKHPALIPPKAPQSAPDSTRRHSLPFHFLPPTLWSANTSSASLIESEEAARGEHILDEATVAHRIPALRQLNGATRSRHRYAKSTGARNSTFSQPVIVRTYSGATRPRSEQRDIVTVRRDSGLASKNTKKMEAKLPPIEAFSFKGIMEEIKHGVTDDLERIAEICARSKYSLSNQYEVHMPPHGRGEPIMLAPHGQGTNANGAGPTLQAVGSDDEQPRYPGRARGGRRAKSAAYGTLETIMSSSRSSDEDKSKKRPAAELAEEVRGRAAKKEKEKENEASPPESEEVTLEAEVVPQRPVRHVRSKSATFASMILDNAHGSKNDAASQLVSPTSLISEPARPQTSTTDLERVSTYDRARQVTSSALLRTMSTKPTMIRNESNATNVHAQSGTIPSLLSGLNSWLPWSKRTANRGISHAESSLRDLILKSTDIDRKGKSVDRSV